MTTFALPASAVEAKAPDATKHVNYTLGMVLGVDDFNQEFAWLSGRDRWLARDTIGYGTVCGLLVSPEKTVTGPRLTVTSGAALTPRGQLVCVKPAQCAYLNDWLAANKSTIPALLGSPMATSLALYLTLCYRDCPVDPVPIPGEPCRSEDEMMVPSRLVDDFSLELRPRPPDQGEEDAIIEFVRWLRALTLGGPAPYATPAQLAQALRDAVGTVTSPLASPLSAPPSVHFSFGSPLASLRLDPALAADYLRTAFRVWIEEIRPRVHAVCAGASGCCTEHGGDTPAPDECLLLARVDVPVVDVGGGTWKVDDTKSVTVDDSRRPLLVHLRLLQEWMTGGSAWGPRVSTIAAGVVGHNFVQPPVLNGLTATLTSASRLRLTFGGYSSPNATLQYVIKAMALNGGPASIANPTIVSDGSDGTGLFVRVSAGGAPIGDAALMAMQFMVEVTRIQ